MKDITEKINEWKIYEENKQYKENEQYEENDFIMKMLTNMMICLEN